VLARARQLDQRTYGRCALVDLNTGRGVYVPGAPDYFQFIDLEAAYDWLQHRHDHTP
jgi:hypothetical protein